MLQIERTILKDIGIIGSTLEADLGAGFGGSIAMSLQHDAKDAFNKAVGLGHFALDTFEKIGKADLEAFWETAKAQMEVSAKSILATFHAHGFAAAEAAAKQMLVNINWRGVATALTGVGESTLAATGSALVRMVITGVLVSL